MMDTLFLFLLVLGTLGLFYLLIVQVALAAGTKYPENVRTPAIVAAVGILACGIVEALQLFGVIGTGTPYQIALSISLVATVVAMWVLAVRL
jgi:hypothetical protein